MCDLTISVLRNFAHGMPKDNPDTPHILIWNEEVLVPICALIWKFIYSQDKNGRMRIKMKGCSAQIPHLFIKLTSSEENTYAKLFLLRKGRCRLELSSRHCFIIPVPSLMLAMKGTGGSKFSVRSTQLQDVSSFASDKVIRHIVPLPLDDSNTIWRSRFTNSSRHQRLRQRQAAN